MTALIDLLARWPETDFTEFGPIEKKPLERIQKLTSSFPSRNWVAIPHVTNHDEADVTALETARREWNLNHREETTLLAPVVKALAAALAAYPIFNTSLDAEGKTLAWKQYVHIGVAVDTPNGLLVAVVRDCDIKAGPDIQAEIQALSAKARTKGLSMAEMSSGCISISSPWHIPGTAVTPIVNAPRGRLPRPHQGPAATHAQCSRRDRLAANAVIIAQLRSSGEQWGPCRAVHTYRQRGRRISLRLT